MASADYRLCDKCGGKAFYDSDLNYQIEKPEYSDDETPVRDCEYWLGYLGDWKVLCRECAKTHKVIIVEV